MDLFSIVCTTCKTRLRVRDPSAVGQILACPRCGGMVMVKPPPHWSGEAVRSDLSTATGLVTAPPPPDQTVGSSAFDAIEELLADAPPRQTPPAADASSATASRVAGQEPKPAGPATTAPATTTPPPARRGEQTANVSEVALPAPSPRPRFVGGPPRGAVEKRPKGNPAPAVPDPPVAGSPPTPTPASTSPAAQGRESKTQSDPGATAPPTSDDPAIPPPPQSTTPRSAAALWSASPWGMASLRLWIALGSSFVVGMLLAVAAVAGAIRLFYGAPRSTPGNTPLVHHDQGHPPVQPTTQRRAEDPFPRQPASSTTSQPLPTAPEGLAASQGPAPPRESDPQDTRPDLPQSPVPKSSPPSPDEATATSPPPPPSSTSPQAGLAPAPWTPRPATTETTDALARFDRFLGGEDVPAAPPHPTPPSAPSSGLPDAGPPSVADEPAADARPVAPRPPPLVVDVPRRLADPLLGVQTSGTPLLDFLQLFSELSTIPITLQPDALPLLRLTPLTPVALDASNTTVGGALTAALRPLGLETLVQGDHLIVRVLEPTALRTIEYPAQDLASNEAERVTLAQWLQSVVEPTSWGEEEGQGSIHLPPDKEVLVIRQRQAVHAVLFIACEKLRVARGKPPASSKYDPALFTLDSRTARAAAKLRQPVTANFRTPTRLVTILRRLGDLTGTSMLVDWQEIASLGWNPLAETSIVFEGQPLAEALDALLEPMDLAWRVVDGQTLQVVSPQRLATQGELELYPVGPLVTEDPQGQQLLARLQSALGEETFVEGGGAGVLRYDPAGRCLLVWLPQPDQRRLEALLKQWAAAARPSAAGDR